MASLHAGQTVSGCFLAACLHAPRGQALVFTSSATLKPE